MSASYGRQSTAICRRGSNLMRNLNCHSRNSLTKVRKLCNKQSRCQLKANNGVFGDPCRGTYKYLHVTYNCIKGKIFLTLRNRNTYIYVIMGYLKNDVIGTLDLIKIKNGWSNHLLRSNFLSFHIYCMFINSLFHILWPLKLEKKDLFFSFSKKYSEL